MHFRNELGVWKAAAGYGLCCGSGLWVPAENTQFFSGIEPEQGRRKSCAPSGKNDDSMGKVTTWV